MSSKNRIRYKLTAKLLLFSASIITIFIVFFAKEKLILGNDFFYKNLVRRENHSIIIEKISDEQFSTNISGLLTNLKNEQLDIDFSWAANLEIGERSCNASCDLTSFFARVSFSIFLPNTPARTITLFVTTPTRGRQTVKLESEESISPELQQTCYEMLNFIIGIDRQLRIQQIHRPIQHSELEVTIQNSWNMLNRQD